MTTKKSGIYLKIKIDTGKVWGWVFFKDGQLSESC